MSRFTSKALLLAAATPFVFAISAPAMAQVAAAPAASPSDSQAVPQDPAGSETATAVQSTRTAPEQAAAADNGQDIVVTGTLFRGTDTTASPVTTITAQNLDQRGISTIQEGIQRLSANNGPALTNSFTANGAFASGASAVSLRGLSTNSTLVLFDGLRAAYYPLADDGTRAFVDLNTIPDDIVDRIDTVLDGASSTYGADAIAGVVNIITKKSFKGVSGRAEGGISERGDASQYRLSMTAGVGDLSENGYNAYVSGFYYQQDQLFNRDRKYPYNTNDFRGVSQDGTQGVNNTINGVQADGGLNGFNFGTPLVVRPRNAATGAAIPGVSSQYQYLNGCTNGSTPYNLTAADRANAVNAASPNTVCQEDLVNRYGVINPFIQRYGASARVTAKYGNDGEAYAAFNFVQTDTAVDGAPVAIRNNAPAPFYFPRYSTASNVAAYGNNTILQLPVYVCASGVNCAAAADRRLNPNNPYAAQGFTAALGGRIPNLPTHDETRTRGYRAAIGAKGTLTGDWQYNISATAMHIDLRRKSDGYPYIQNLLNAINTGSYNFRDPAANSAATLALIAPTAIGNSTSDLDEFDASVTGKLFDLPGGPLQLAVGGAVRYEAVDSPSINSDLNGPTQRYFTLNGFALKGSRTVFSAYGELNAPIIDQVTLSASGRYDRYPNGIDNFSPKAGIVFKPVRQLTLRGTYSRGFRIPSFGESSATFPTTGYVTASRGIYNDAYLRQYGCSLATYTTCPSYLTSASYGATSLSNPELKPEKSRSFTGGAILEPIRGVTLKAGYYNIKKTNVITTANNSPAIQAYYSGQAVPAGYNIIPDAVDVNNPNATPRIAFVQSGFINANTLKTSGIDFGADVQFPIGQHVKFSTNAQATYILKLETEFPDGTVERYDGTLGNFNLTAGSGTPKWRGTLTSTIDIDDTFLLSGTANYFDGYDLSATDQGTGYKDCGLNDGSLPCHTSDYVTVDLTAQVKINDAFTFYFTAQNILDDFPPIDTVTYGANGYNPVQGGEGILGRYFKAGVKVGF
ncbi:TonB-dependent receptor domain-containing protein [Sphingomonas faeni]|uniref:TonB-dependent receptor domain-containing protein n=1 Tax=Sphingomonas faeni TaxID=185950 RepID=UPI0033506559